VFFLLGTLLLVAVFWFFEKPESTTPAVLTLLFAGSFLLRWGYHAYFPQLQLWDEQFHALVAKNMADTPLHPRLYAPHVYPFDYTIWVSNETWLHKQPWFLWQMALFVKLFGAEVWVVRLPSLLMAAGFPVIVFGIVRRLVNHKTALVAGVLAAGAFYFSWWASGYRPTDHNDVAFVFYVSLGCWAVLQYIHSKAQWRFVFLISLFVGIAVLNKWLVGLFPLLFLGLWLLFDPEVRYQKQHWIRLAIMVAGVLFIVFPWQWHIFINFPEEAAWEAAYNSRHFFEVLESQEQPWYFHFKNLAKLFIYPNRSFGWVLLLPALLYSGRTLLFSNAIWKAYTASALFVLLFFSVAATKMPGFTYLLAPLVFAVLANFLQAMWRFFSFLVKRSKVVRGVVAAFLFFGIYFYAVPSGPVDPRGVVTNRFFEGRVTNYEKLLSIDAYLPADDSRWVIFNTVMYEDIVLMFHTKKDLTAYSRVPTGNDIHIAHENNYRIAVVQQEGQVLPEYVTENARILVLPIVMQPHDFY
jgi:4-amino-4-deoxy-L-arabinose transferase